MRKIAVCLTLIGVLASGAGLALADEMPADLKMVPESKSVANLSSGSDVQLRRVSRGDREMPDRRMHADRMGMHAMRHTAMGAMAPEPGKPTQAGRGC